MNFLPNKFMRYTAALRVYIGNSIIRNGIMKKQVESMQKIYNAEAVFSDEQPIPIELYNYLQNLLTAVYIKKTEQEIPFIFKIRINSNYMIELKSFTALILNICKTAKTIEIYKENGNVIIKTDAIEKHSRKLAKKLKGCVYFERVTNSALIALPFTATDKKQDFNVKTAEDYLTDPFSLINVFI